MKYRYILYFSELTRQYIILKDGEEFKKYSYFRYEDASKDFADLIIESKLHG